MQQALDEAGIRAEQDKERAIRQCIERERAAMANELEKLKVGDTSGNLIHVLKSLQEELGKAKEKAATMNDQIRAATEVREVIA